MKGAIAEPLVNIMRNPKRSSTTMSGRSQNFFRTFKNPHRSFKKSTIFYLLISSLVRPFKVFCSITVIALQEYGVPSPFPFPHPHRICPENPPEQAHGCNDQQKNNKQENMRNFISQPMGEAKPDAGGGTKDSRPGHGEDEDCDRRHDKALIPAEMRNKQ